MNSTTFTIDGAALKEAVGFVKAGLGSGTRKLSDILIRFDLKEDGVTLYASDGDLVAVTDVPAEGATEGLSFAVVGKRLQRLMPTVVQCFTFTVDPENVEIRGVAGGDPSRDLVVNFERQDGDLLDFARVAREKFDGSSRPPFEAAAPKAFFVSALEAAASNTSPTTESTVSHVEIRQGRILSSDGRRLGSVASPLLHDSVALRVPVALMSRFMAGLKTCYAEATFQITGGDSHYFVYDDAPMGLRLLAIRKTDTAFPATEQLIDNRDGADTVFFNRESLDKALSAVALGLPLGNVNVEMVLGRGLSARTVNSVGRVSYKEIQAERSVSEEISLPTSIDLLQATIGAFTSERVKLIVGTESILFVDLDEEREVATVVPLRAAMETSDDAPSATGSSEEGDPLAGFDAGEGETEDDGSEIEL